VSSREPRKTPELYDSIAREAEAVRLQSAQRYGPLWDAYITMGYLLSSLIPQGTEDPVLVPKGASQRISLTANLLQSTTIVEHSISSGFYWAASALLRQHMEALARIIHIRSGKLATDSRPPNVSVLPFKLAQNYGRLSELAHVSSGELLKDFSLSSSGEEVATHAPTYREDWSRKLLTVHIEHMVVLAIEINLLHRELYPEKLLVDLAGAFRQVAKILVEEGFWKKIELDLTGRGDK
jgi:glycosyltransferase involved in cell wall biosynthesis